MDRIIALVGMLDQLDKNKDEAQFRKIQLKLAQRQLGDPSETSEYFPSYTWNKNQFGALQRVTSGGMTGRTSGHIGQMLTDMVNNKIFDRLTGASDAKFEGYHYNPMVNMQIPWKKSWYKPPRSYLGFQNPGSWVGNYMRHKRSNKYKFRGKGGGR